jgi:hypothetical protein
VRERGATFAEDGRRLTWQSDKDEEDLSGCIVATSESALALCL